MASDEPFTGRLYHYIAFLPIARLRVIEKVLLAHHFHRVDPTGVLVSNELNTTKASLTNDFD